MRVRTRGSRLSSGAGIEGGIWSPFRSLLTAQVASAVLGLVFWILVARLVDAEEVGIAAAAISAQTLLGIVTVMGLSTMLIAELPLHAPGRQRQILLRALLVVFLTSALVGGLIALLHPLLPSNLNEALGNPIGAVTFVVGTAAFAWALVVDDAALAVRSSGVQVQRNLFASGLRFPVTLALLALGFTDAHVLQICWVLPLIASVPFSLWRLGLPHGDRTSPSLLDDLKTFVGPALRNHALSLSLAAGSQMVPVVAGLTLASVQNAQFAIAWLAATFVFLPPYLLATALFAHGANVSTEEFRKSMEKTIPGALLLSALLCVGAWVLGEPVLLIFGGEYSSESWKILALLAPAGLWMVFKDHLVALWRSQRRFTLATRLAGAALLLEVVGAVTGGVFWGAQGLCIGWLAAMGVEVLLGGPWLRQAFGGLHWQWPMLRRRTQAGRVAPLAVAGVALAVAVAGVGFWAVTHAGDDDAGGGTTTDASGLPEPGTTIETCTPTADRPGPQIDLNVQSATGDGADPLRSYDEVRSLVSLAQQAGATVISTSASFRTMQPTEDTPYQFQYIDRTIGAARSAGLQVRLQLTGMPDWALDDPTYARQAPRSEAELERWAAFVTEVMKHVDGKVDYLEVWNEPNSEKWWPTGEDPVEFARLMSTTYGVVHTVSPATKVISGGLIGNDLGYLSKVYDAVKTIGLTATPFDMVGAHPFSGSVAPDVVDAAKRYDRDPFGLYDENFTGFMGLHQVMAKHGDKSLPIYISQFGYSVRSAPQREAVPDDVRAGYLTQAMEQATCVPYVSVFSWYALHPTPWDPQEWTLVDRSLRPNKTYDALAAWGKLVTAATAGQS